MSGIPSSLVKACILKSLSGLTSKFSKSAWPFAPGVRRDEDQFSGGEAAGSNLRASDSRITDADSAREIIAYTKSKILSGAALSVSGQANQRQRRIISLIQ